MSVLSRKRHPKGYVSIGCDVPGCRARPPAGPDRDAAYATARAAGWLIRSRDSGRPRRRQMDFCPVHVPTCHYQPCRNPGSTTDHIVPRWWGGQDRHTNYIDACYQHNIDKGSVFPTCTCRDCTRAVRGWLNLAEWSTVPPLRQHRALALAARARPELVATHLRRPLPAPVPWAPPRLYPGALPSAPSTPYDRVCSLLTRTETTRAAADPSYDFLYVTSRSFDRGPVAATGLDPATERMIP